MPTLRSWYEIIIDAIFPQNCAGCGAAATPLCDACMMRSYGGRTPEQTFIRSIFDYQKPCIRKTIWQLKYRNGRDIAKIFGKKMHEDIIEELAERMCVSKSHPFIVIPIPLHKKRQRERGYNQSELLAREIISHDLEKIFHLERNALIRIRETDAQAKNKRRSTRFENLRGAFSANKELVTNENIILIDDVTTTGATLAEARRELLKAGAKKVLAWTVAH